MKPLPPLLAWPPLMTLEEARRENDQAIQALDRVFQQNAAAPEALKAALESAERASTQEYYAWLEAPRWN